MGYKEVKNNICIELIWYILEEIKGVRCRINNLLLLMIRIKIMRVVSGVEFEVVWYVVFINLGKNDIVIILSL